ncbi:MAG: hypothetical protein WD379_05170 [Dehalococcoidia bacterium]
MNRFLLPLAAIAVAGALSAPLHPAHACSCAFPFTEEQVREAMGYYDAAVLASIASTPNESNLQVDVETVYKGDPGERITLEQPIDLPPDFEGDGLAYLGADCSFALLGQPGERYVLFLTAADGGSTYAPSGCASFPLAWTETTEEFRAYHDSLERIAGTDAPAAPPEDDTLPQPWQAPTDSGPDVPWLPIIGGAAAAGVALLAAGAWLLRRRTPA